MYQTGEFLDRWARDRSLDPLSGQQAHVKYQDDLLSSMSRQASGLDAPRSPSRNPSRISGIRPSSQSFGVSDEDWNQAREELVGLQWDTSQATTAHAPLGRMLSTDGYGPSMTSHHDSSFYAPNSPVGCTFSPDRWNSSHQDISGIARTHDGSRSEDIRYLQDNDFSNYAGEHFRSGSRLTETSAGQEFDATFFPSYQDTHDHRSDFSYRPDGQIIQDNRWHEDNCTLSDGYVHGGEKSFRLPHSSQGSPDITNGFVDRNSCFQDQLLNARFDEYPRHRNLLPVPESSSRLPRSMSKSPRALSPFSGSNGEYGPSGLRQRQTLHAKVAEERLRGRLQDFSSDLHLSSSWSDRGFPLDTDPYHSLEKPPFASSFLPDTDTFPLSFQFDPDSPRRLSGRDFQQDQFRETPEDSLYYSLGPKHFQAQRTPYHVSLNRNLTARSDNGSLGVPSRDYGHGTLHEDLPRLVSGTHAELSPRLGSSHSALKMSSPDYYTPRGYAESQRKPHSSGQASLRQSGKIPRLPLSDLFDAKADCPFPESLDILPLSRPSYNAEHEQIGRVRSQLDASLHASASDRTRLEQPGSCFNSDGYYTARSEFDRDHVGSPINLNSPFESSIIGTTSPQLSTRPTRTTHAFTPANLDELDSRVEEILPLDRLSLYNDLSASHGTSTRLLSNSTAYLNEAIFLNELEFQRRELEHQRADLERQRIRQENSDVQFRLASQIDLLDRKSNVLNHYRDMDFNRQLAKLSRFGHFQEHDAVSSKQTPYLNQPRWLATVRKLSDRTPKLDFGLSGGGLAGAYYSLLADQLPRGVPFFGDRDGFFASSTSNRAAHIRDPFTEPIDFDYGCGRMEALESYGFRREKFERHQTHLLDDLYLYEMLLRLDRNLSEQERLRRWRERLRWEEIVDSRERVEAWARMSADARRCLGIDEGSFWAAYLFGCPFRSDMGYTARPLAGPAMRPTRHYELTAPLASRYPMWAHGGLGLGRRILNWFDRPYRAINAKHERRRAEIRREYAERRGEIPPIRQSFASGLNRTSLTDHVPMEFSGKLDSSRQPGLVIRGFGTTQRQFPPRSSLVSSNSFPRSPFPLAPGSSHGPPLGPSGDSSRGSAPSPKIPRPTSFSRTHPQMPSKHRTPVMRPSPGPKQASSQPPLAAASSGSPHKSSRTSAFLNTSAADGRNGSRESSSIANRVKTPASDSLRGSRPASSAVSGAKSRPDPQPNHSHRTGLGGWHLGDSAPPSGPLKGENKKNETPSRGRSPQSRVASESHRDSSPIDRGMTHSVVFDPYVEKISPDDDLKRPPSRRSQAGAGLAPIRSVMKTPPVNPRQSVPAQLNLQDERCVDSITALNTDRNRATPAPDDSRKAQ